MSHPWLAYKNWAVVGVSKKEESYGNKIYHKLMKHGYNVYPVSPKHEEIDGNPVYSSVDAIPEEVEVVDFVVNPRIGIQVLEDCGKKGVKRIVLQPGTESQEIHKRAKELGIEAVEGCVLVMLSWK